MARLEDFSTSSVDFTLEDLADVSGKVVVGNPPSNKNLAAISAGIAGPDKLEENYRSILSETSEGPSSATSEDIIQQAQDKDREDALKALIEYTSNPEVPIEQKQSAVQGFEENVNNNNSPQTLLAKKFVVEDSAGETPEAEEVRSLSQELWGDINSYNQEMQRRLNVEILKNDNNLAQDVAQLAEMIVPFTEAKAAAEIAKSLKSEGGYDTGFLLDTLLTGSTKAGLRDMFQSMDLEDRLKFSETFINIINNHSGIFLSDTNQFARADYLRSVLEGGYYTDTDEWVDNAFSLLDATIIGAVPKSVLKAGSKVGKMYKVASKHRTVQSSVQPSTTSQILKEVNPEHSREAFEASSYSDEAAEAIYGTTPNEVVANDLLPELGEVARNKVGNINAKGDGPTIKDQKVLDFLTNNDGGIYLTSGERAKATEAVVNDLRNANGFTVRNEMSTYMVDGNNMTVRMVYGPEEGGFLDPQDAVNSFLFNMRRTSITKDDLVLLKNEAGHRVPVSTDVTEPGDYLISLDVTRKLSDNVKDYESFDVKRNFFDRLSFGGTNSQGTLQSHLLDAHSMLKENLTLGASVQVDKAVGLESALSESTRVFQETYAKMSKSKRLQTDNFIKRARDEELAFNTTTMKAHGLDESQRTALKSWREFWDTHYWMENSLLVKDLRKRNYKVLEHGGEKHFVKEVKEHKVKGPVKAFDPVQNKVVPMSEKDMSDLYSSNGTLAEFRRPMLKGGAKVDYIISPEKIDGPYLRGISEGDQVINYKKGYYQTFYDQPFFIDKIVLDKNGKEIGRRAVATAGTVKDATNKVNRLTKADREGNLYEFRTDKKKMRLDSDDSWDLSISAGRTAQRHRGERLEDASGNIDDLGSNILDPMEAMVRSIRSVSRRTSMVDYLDSYKNRFMQQYAKVLPKDEYGNPKFPDNRGQIGANKFLDKETADARTAFEYYRSLEDGYSNSIDDFYKAVMFDMAGLVGQASSKGEKFIREIGSADPTQLAKTSTFKAYLAANPLRQWIVQSHQMVRLTALFPDQMFSGKLLNQMTALSLHMRGVKVPDVQLKVMGMNQADLIQMGKDWEKSGLAVAVDANNLVRGDLKKLANTTMAQKAAGVANLPFKVGQRLGFDRGEDINIKSAWLAYRNQALKEGKELTSTVRDEISANARNITYNMNSAGDLPYNRNNLNIVFQYLQVPHKSLTQWTNRALSRKDRVKLGIFDLVMFGVPPGVASTIYGSLLPDDPEARHNIEAGLWDLILNSLASAITSESSNINFKESLAPGNIVGIYEVVSEVLQGDVGEAIANSPSGQMFFGGNPRVTNLVKTAARFTNLIDDYEDPTEFAQVARAATEVMSGASNYYKSAYALDYGRKISSLYSVTDYNITSAEAVAQLFGMQTWDETLKRRTKKEIYDKEFLKNDIRSWYNELKIHLSRKGITPKEIEYEAKIFSEALRGFKDHDTEAKNEIRKLISRDIQNNDLVLFDGILKLYGMRDTDELIRIANDSGLEDEDRKRLVEEIEFLRDFKVNK